MTKPIIYTKPDCRWCDMTKQVFRRNGIEWDEDDILKPENLEMAKERGFMSAPVVVWDDEAWCGFRPDKIVSILEKAA